MKLLENVKIGTLVRINVSSSKERFSNETIELIKASPKCRITDFKITDGKGIGVLLKLSNGKIQWFFENEIEILDQEGNVIIKEEIDEKNLNEILNNFKNINYTPKNKIKDLSNPINFFMWLFYVLKDNI